MELPVSLAQQLTHLYIPGYDIYRPEISDELQAFFDAYCRPSKQSQAANWEALTPLVRLSLLGFEASGSAAKTIVERPEPSYPLERQILRTLYLDAETMTMKKSAPGSAATASYEGRILHSQLVGYNAVIRPDHDLICQ